jgi:hypothetical protein
MPDPTPTLGSTPGSSAPPNFYAQAAQGQSATPAKPDYRAQNDQFNAAVTKLLAIFDKLEKLTPNGQKIDKDIRSLADSLKATRDKVMEGADGEGADSDAAQAGGAADTTGTGGGTAAAAGGPGAAPAPGTGA